MTRKDDLRKWRDGLRATFPLVGGLRRRWAMDALEQHRNEPEVIPLLVEALGATDDAIAQRASAALRGLTAGPAVGALCAVWAQGRDTRLAEIIVERRYVAQKPAPLRVLSGLKTGANDVLSQMDAEPVPHLVAALKDSEADVRQNALTVLGTLRRPEAVDALCGLWMQKRDSQLAEIIVDRRYVAQKPAQLRVLSGLKAGATDVLTQVDAEPVPHLVAALDDADATIGQKALRVLQDLRRPEAMDALCALWAQQRDERLARIIAQRNYVASQPLQLKLLTALKCGKRVAVDRADLVPLCVALLSDADKRLREGAMRSLEQVRQGPAQDAATRRSGIPAAQRLSSACRRTNARLTRSGRVCSCS